ncbi:pimeloyl-ACP methyl ester carboxylesterase [Pantoea sp. AN62]|uniref:alpha/beta fold hydrolase n=1 Tax=unclassified Pantoea TaxID=2630326 RepID=UPI0018268538|nr:MULTISPECIES: alpha/beta hydrolase [unclassified Pantoea]MDU4128726.1 alpha/beta hydrolase [Pantoea sp.]MDU4747459.1 alpha/beta hydrolase [Pantoea sp.]
MRRRALNICAFISSPARCGPGWLTTGRLSSRPASQNHQRAQAGKLPLLAVSAEQGSIPDMATSLRTVAEQVSGAVILNCGHFIPDEQPEKLVEILTGFLTH